MPFYLQVEMETKLSPPERAERFVKPISEALALEGLGQVLEPEPDEDRQGQGQPGIFEIAMEVNDIEKARAVVKRVLKSLGEQEGYSWGG